MAGSLSELCKHQFANYVVQSIMAHGSTEQQSQLIHVILANFRVLSRHRMGNNVVRCALLHGSASDSSKIAEAIAADSGLKKHSIGSYLKKEAAKTDLGF